MKKTILQRRYKAIIGQMTNDSGLMLFYVRMRNYSNGHPGNFLLPRHSVSIWNNNEKCPIPRNHFNVLIRNPKLILRLKPQNALVALWYLNRSGKDAKSVIEAWNSGSKDIIDAELLKYRTLQQFQRASFQK